MKVGIIDYLRKFDLLKQGEFVYKIINTGGVEPTIVPYKNYAKRFKKAMKSYFIQNFWSNSFVNINDMD